MQQLAIKFRRDRETTLGILRHRTERPAEPAAERERLTRDELAIKLEETIQANMPEEPKPNEEYLCQSIVELRDQLDEVRKEVKPEKPAVQKTQIKLRRGKDGLVKAVEVTKQVEKNVHES
jgi:hypothetical protein